MGVELTACLHCGTPFYPTPQRADYCCSGCEFVRGLIVEKGLGTFYDLKEAPVPPVTSLVFQQRDYRWLEELVQLREVEEENVSELKLDLQGISCVGCVWLVEKLFMRRVGAVSIEVDAALGKMRLRWERGHCDLPEFAREILAFGYLVGPEGKSLPEESQGLVRRIGLCAAFMMNSMLFAFPDYLGMESTFEYSRLFHFLLVVFATLSYLVGGSYFLKRTWHSLRHGVLHLDLPISLGVTAAYVGSLFAWWHGAMHFVYLEFVSTFIFLMLVGRWLQQKALERNRHRLLDAGMGIPPVTALESEERIEVEEVKCGLAYRGGSGQVVPVRSKLLSSDASVGLDWISGEAGARHVRAGELVPSGAILLGQQEVTLEALEDWSESVLASLVKIVTRDPFRNLAVEHWIRGYLFVILGVAFAGGCYWQWQEGEWLRTLQVVTSILVVSCPCATGVALPMIDDLLVRRLQAIGVFVRELTLWSKLPGVRKIIFDKTGTITFDTLALKNRESLDALTDRDRENLLNLVWENWHPVSICLRSELLAMGTRLKEKNCGAITECPGYGLEDASTEGKWRLGRPSWAIPEMKEFQGGIPDTILSRDGEEVARFYFSEEIRPDSVSEMMALHRKGYEIHLLSGDRRSKVEAMSQKLNLPISRCLAELTPEEKAERIRALDRQDTLMIGDGANDSLAFNASWCTGTPAADRGLLERKADFYFLGRGLIGVRQLLMASEARQKTIRRVFTFTILYNLTVVILSLLGKMSPVMAAILMPSSSVVSLAIVFASLPDFQRMKAR